MLYEPFRFFASLIYFHSSIESFLSCQIGGKIHTSSITRVILICGFYFLDYLLLVQWNLDLRKISTCKFTYIRHFLTDRSSDSVHKSFLNQKTLDLRKKKLGFLN